METFARASSREWQGRRRRLLPVAAWSCAMAMVLALAAVAAATSTTKGENEATSTGIVVGAVSRIATSAAAPQTRQSVTLICQSTPYPSACETALSSAEARSAADPFAASVQFAIARATAAHALARNLSASTPTDPPSGMRDCVELLDITLHQLGDALAGSASDAQGARTWLSAAMTYQDTCNESLAAVPASAGRDAVRRQVGALAQFIGTALALHVSRMEGQSGTAPSAAPAPSTGRHHVPVLAVRTRQEAPRVPGGQPHAGRRGGAGWQRNAQKHQRCGRRRHGGALSGERWPRGRS